jgi:VWFA-related protein
MADGPVRAGPASAASLQICEVVFAVRVNQIYAGQWFTWMPDERFFFHIRRSHSQCRGLWRLYKRSSLSLISLSLLSSASQDPVIRVSVDLVQVDASVTDRQGKRVADLKPEDFQVFEDGKQQKITHFSYMRGGPVPAAVEATAPINLGPPKPLQRDQVRRTIVMVVDNLGLLPEDTAGVRQAMKNFVNREMQPSDLASILTTAAGQNGISQLTNDKRQLYAAIDRIHYVPGGRTGMDMFDPVGAPNADANPGFSRAVAARVRAARAPALTMTTMSALAYAIQGLREMPGRKAVALFSDGFPAASSGIIQMANRSSVVIYTFDPRGLASYQCTGKDGGCPADLAQKRATTFRTAQAGLDQLARGTGGIFFHDKNDLDRGLREALDDMGSYYLIGYQPRREDFEPVRSAARFHTIEVKVLRAGLQVRSRNGFLGTPDLPARAVENAPKSSKEELRKALFSPFHGSGFPVRLTALYSAANAKDPKTGRRGAVLRAMLALNGHDLLFRDLSSGDASGGRKQIDLEVLVSVFSVNDDSGLETVASLDRIFAAPMGPEEVNQILTSGLVYSLDVPVPKPGAYQLRVGVWDANAKQTGSAAAFVDIPDFNRQEIALSSITLFDSDPTRNAALTRAGVTGAGSPATRIFGPGAVLQYECKVFGALADRRTGKRQVDVAVRLFRGTEQIFDGPPMPLAVTDGNSSSIPAAGDIRLPSTLAPGDYSLELSAYDRLQKQQLQHAAQWIDFTLVNQK